MPLYMDVHIVPGVKSKDVAEAHYKDLLHQHEYGCKCMTYWIDEDRENIFCLVEAPDKDAVKEMHRKSHGLMPNKIIEVSSKIVQSFLGRIFDPDEAEVDEAGLKVFTSSSFRILLVTKTVDPVLLQHKLGKENAHLLLSNLNNVIRTGVARYGGAEVELGGTGFIISFTSASAAVSCALSIIQHVPKDDANLADLRIAVNAGDPVEQSNKLFGNTIQFALNLCAIPETRLALASAVKDLVLKDNFQAHQPEFVTLSPQDEVLLQSLFTRLAENWQNPDFDMEHYCHSMAMSTSQLYRKTVALTGLSPNLLLKDFRLEKAKEMMKKKHYSIAQVTFEAGFTSPSYFTKCFKKKFGLLPATYLDLLP